MGRLDILSVNGKWMDSAPLLTGPRHRQSPPEQRAKALVKIGVVRSQQGDYAGAMKITAPHPNSFRPDGARCPMTSRASLRTPTRCPTSP